MRPSTLFALLAAALVVLGGCTTRSSKDDALLFDIPGPVAVLVESFGGDVTIEADPRLTQASVRVKRAADFGFVRESDASAALDAIGYTASLESTGSGPVLTIRATSDHPESHGLYAHVTIRMPAVDGLTVRTARGDVYATNCQGATEISTTGGDVRYMTNWAITQPVTITNKEGTIDFRVRGESTGAIEASTIDGKVRERARHGRFVIHSHTGRAMRATLNDGTNPILLTTEEGHVRIAVVHDPTAVGVFIVDP